MLALNFPTYDFKLKSDDGATYIYDVVRKKYVVLNAEEWVRQHTIHFLNKEKGYPLSLTAVEKELKYNELKKRFDIMVYGVDGLPKILVECKAPEIKLTQEVFNQIAVYNSRFLVDILIVTNGLQHFCCLKNKNNNYSFVKEVPHYTQLIIN